MTKRKNFSAYASVVQYFPDGSRQRQKLDNAIVFLRAFIYKRWDVEEPRWEGAEFSSQQRQVFIVVPSHVLHLTGGGRGTGGDIVL